MDGMKWAPPFKARSLSQMQVADELMEIWDPENRTLDSDGTSKHGRSFITEDVVKADLHSSAHTKQMSDT